MSSERRHRILRDYGTPRGIRLMALPTTGNPCCNRPQQALLIAQFAGGGPTQSSGYIAAYDMTTGRFRGLLEDTSGNPLAINGIWAISPGNTSPNNFDSAGAPSAELYFTAGPNHGSGRLFGYLTAISSELIQGNDQ